MTASPEPSRGEVWLVRFGSNQPGEPGKNRPAIVLSIDSLRTGSERDLIVVVPLSATEPGSQMRPPVVPADAGVDRPSVALPTALRAIGRTRLLHRLGGVPPDTLDAIEQVLLVTLGLDR
ncbi:MAG: type II toxin-antitoxin system PemK/MazF family toxin [Solirubrobacterales bacterium]|nr:type II toxin-antitoxin system PemK/MazF family toxin [Solirubrobacterales bacterium]